MVRRPFAFLIEVTKTVNKCDAAIREKLNLEAYGTSHILMHTSVLLPKGHLLAGYWTAHSPDLTASDVDLITILLSFKALVVRTYFTT